MITFSHGTNKDRIRFIRLCTGRKKVYSIVLTAKGKTYWEINFEQGNPPICNHTNRLTRAYQTLYEDNCKFLQEKTDEQYLLIKNKVKDFNKENR